MLTLSKGGRKKRVDAERYPGGRIRQAHQRNTATDVVTAQRLLEASRKRMEDPKWATPLGRLVLEDKITATCMMAGERFAELVERYRMLIGAPKPSPSLLERRPGRALQVDPFNESEVKRAKHIENQYQRISAHILSMKNGIGILRALHDLCVRQEHITYDRLVLARQGLGMLVVAFGLVRK